MGHRSAKIYPTALRVRKHMSRLGVSSVGVCRELRRRNVRMRESQLRHVRGQYDESLWFGMTWWLRVVARAPVVCVWSTSVHKVSAIPKRPVILLLRKQSRSNGRAKRISRHSSVFEYSLPSDHQPSSRLKDRQLPVTTLSQLDGIGVLCQLRLSQKSHFTILRYSHILEPAHRHPHRAHDSGRYRDNILDLSAPCTPQPNHRFDMYHNQWRPCRPASGDS